MKRGILLGILFLVIILNFVSAEGEVCCEKLISGASCQDASIDLCDRNFGIDFNPCSDFDVCKNTGCCFNEGESSCSNGAYKSGCVGEGLIWKQGVCENVVDDCEEVCCWLGGGSTERMEKGKCRIASEKKNIDMKTTNDGEETCRDLSEDVGACVTGESCSQVSEKECKGNLNGDFLKNKFCSDNEIKEKYDIDYVVKDHLGCAIEDDLTDVYYFDSAGNREGVKEECKLEDGYICSEETGEAECKFLGCAESEETLNKKRVHGETWCLWDGYTGNSRDAVGSEHFRAACVAGEVRIERCGEYRTGICAESKRIIGKDTTISQAQCRDNLGGLCYGIDNVEDCLKNVDCRVEKVAITERHGGDSEHILYDVCVAKVPIGFDITPERVESLDEAVTEVSGQITKENVCGMVYESCPLYVQDGTSKEKNKFCSNWIYPYEFNNLCTAFGDCGRWINTELEKGYNEDLIFISGPGDKLSPSFKSVATSGSIYDYESFFKGIKNNNEGDSLELDNDLIENFVGRGAEEYAEKNTPDFQTPEPTAGIFYPTELIKINPNIDLDRGASHQEGYSTWTTNPKGYYPQPVKAYCYPWSPPIAEDSDCKKCNEEIIPCTEYKCESLGANCVILPEVSIDEFAESEEIEIVGDLANYLEVGGLGPEYQEKICVLNTELNRNEEPIVKLTKEGGDACVEGGAELTFNVEITNEQELRSICKYDFEEYISYENMEFYATPQAWETEFKIKMNALPPESEEKIYSVYVKCMGANQISNYDAKEITYCVKPEAETRAPKIQKVEIDTGSAEKFDVLKNNYFLKFGEDGVLEDSVTLEITLDEIGKQCRYSLNPDAIFEDLPDENIFGCEDDSFSCPNILIQGLANAENKVYLKCSDKNGNVQDKETIVTIKQSASPLLIDSMKIDSTEILGTPFVRYSPVNSENPLVISVDTSGGAYGGKSDCIYGLLENFYGNSLGNADSISHVKTLSQIPEGNYILKVGCSDDAGNSVSAEGSFSLDTDDDAPIILIKYTEANSLKMITNELAQCAYSTDDCNFNFDNAQKMGSVYDVNHQLSFTEGFTYHIICRDIWDNERTCEKISIVR
ncbi:hypothetical protein J4481_00885 [Candidatus Pacearchaeota archaeon]|nr:hypothetical protein [Candidatus Pacearchaeota archaeon]